MTKKQDVIEILKMIESRDGLVTPTAVVNEARSELSPIHDAFEWDNDEAAEKYRLWQARQLVASVRVEWLGKEVDGYHNVVVEINNEPAQGYVSLERVLSKEELHKQVIKSALGELEYWQEKYRELSELSGVINKRKVEQVSEALLV